MHRANKNIIIVFLAIYHTWFEFLWV